MSPQPKELPQHAQRLLSILRKLREWSTQSIIAAQLGRDRLDSEDFLALNLLVERQLIEARYVESSRRRSLEYRFIETGDEADTPPVDV